MYHHVLTPFRPCISVALCLVMLSLNSAWAGSGQVQLQVVDSHNGRPLSEVILRLSLAGEIWEAETDSEGLWQASGFEPGRYQIRASLSGYQSSRDTELLIADAQATEAVIQLEPAAQLVEEVLVTGTVVIGADPLSSVGTSYIDREALRSAAGSGSDVMRSLDGLPGLFADGEYSSFTVRGNGPRDNLILVDGIPFDNVVHFSDSFGAQEDVDGDGRFSVFAPDVIGSAEFQPGGWGAAYSGRSGSLLKLEVAEGNLETARYNTRLDIAGLEVGYDGPSRVHDNTSVLFSARQLNFGRVFDLIGQDDLGTPRLTDIIFKSTTQLTPDDKLNILTIYAPEQYRRDIHNVLASKTDDGSYDNVSLIESKVDNTLLGATWSRFFAGDQELVNRLYYRRFTERRSVGEAYPDLVSEDQAISEIPMREGILLSDREETELGLRTDFSADNALGRLSTGVRLVRSSLDFELELTEDWIRYSFDQNDFRADPDQQYIVLTPEFTNNRFQQSAVNYAVYAEQEVPLLDWLMRFGLRYDRDNFSNKDLLSPRIGVTWFASDALRITSTGGRYYQSPRFNDRARDAANARLENEVVDQFSLGFAWLLMPRVELFVEPYYQSWSNLVVKQDGVNQTFANTGEGESWGVDTAITRQFYGDWSADFKYSYNQANFRRSPGGEDFPAEYSRPHSLSFGGVWDINPRWKLSARWKWASGRPRDGFIVHENVLGEGQPLRFSQEITEPSADRYASFNSLNFRADYRRAVAAVDVIAFVDVINILGSSNPSSSSFNERTGLETVESGSAFPLVGLRLEW